MVLLADVGGSTGVRTALNSVKVPPDVIEQIVRFLESTAGDFDPEGFARPQDAWFGNGNSALTLGLHTGKAHAKIENALLEAVLGIQDTTSAMVTFDKEISAADADSEAAAQALLHRTQLAVDQMDGDRNTPPTHTNAPGSDR